MEDYIYKRYKRAEQVIKDEIWWCVNHRRAKDIDFKTIRERVLAPTNIKSFPKVYRDQLMAILNFCYVREVHEKFMYPVFFEGKLYSKWDLMPPECRKMLMAATGEDALRYRPYPVFSWHFTEGMDATNS